MCLPLSKNLNISETSIIVAPRTTTGELCAQIKVKMPYLLSLSQNMKNGWEECFFFHLLPKISLSKTSKFIKNSVFYSVHQHISIAIVLWAVLQNSLDFSLLFKVWLKKLLLPENSNFPNLCNSHVAKKEL